MRRSCPRKWRSCTGAIHWRDNYLHMYRPAKDEKRGVVRVQSSLFFTKLAGLLHFIPSSCLCFSLLVCLSCSARLNVLLFFFLLNRRGWRPRTTRRISFRYVTTFLRKPSFSYGDGASAETHNRQLKIAILLQK